MITRATSSNSAPGTQHSALGTQHSAPSTQHSLSTAFRALLTDATPAPSPDLGDWQSVYDDLARVPDLGARRRAFEAAAKATPALRQILNGQPSPFTLQPLPPAVVTATDVLRMEFPPRRYVVPGLLPAGLTLLAGRPKQGKSWITLQIGLAIATAGQVFGETVPQGRGLICALEDGYERLQNRMQLQGWPDPCDAVQYVISLDELGGPLDGPGLAALEQRIVEHRLTYVVVDTIIRAVKVGDVNDMAEATDALKGLQELALRRDVAIVCVHHTNKANGDDFLDSVAGSTGWTAVADGIAVLKRRRFEDTAALHVVHRDLGKERSIALKWSDDFHRWDYAGDATTVQRAEDQRDVLAAMLSLTKLGESATPQKIADVVDRNRGNVYKDLAGLVELGLVIKSGRRGAYSLTQEGHLEALRLQADSHVTGNGETAKHEKRGNAETNDPVST